MPNCASGTVPPSFDDNLPVLEITHDSGASFDLLSVDVISSAGYRIGPGEIEDSLLKHPAVLQAAVIGKPDELRGQIVKAFVVLSPGHDATPELAREIQQSVRERLSAHEYPREVEFIDSLPMTTTGKVRRIDLRAREQQ